MARTPRPTSDPLADLRDETPAGPPAEHPLTEADVIAGPTYDQAWHDAAAAQAVAVFHRDAVAQGILHKGGTCPCAYLSRLTLVAAVGEPRDDDPEDEADDGEGTDG